MQYAEEIHTAIRFAFDPERRQALLEGLAPRLVACLASHQGLLESSLEIGADGDWLVQRSRWRSPQAAHQALGDGSCGAQLLGEAIWRYGARSVWFE
ncbi:hypothetical protein [Metapseudomonas otitidis]|uniref:hypothetical protein n=1 Tax=Metapseudomonas otitidis TaxID=319939 RepID=UPI0013F599F7|nr:hypothetical protein [Pseudomonas otitidis]